MNVKEVGLTGSQTVPSRILSILIMSDAGISQGTLGIRRGMMRNMMEHEVIQASNLTASNISVKNSLNSKSCFIPTNVPL